MSGRFWEEKTLDAMTREEWESLCDGCGKCCVHKLLDDDTDELHPTNIACKLLDRNAGCCTDYRRRRAFVPDCVRLTPKLLDTISWLPATCAYRLIHDGKPLPDWHYLICGDREAVHHAGESVRGWTVSENDAGDPEHHLVDRDL